MQKLSGICEVAYKPGLSYRETMEIIDHYQILVMRSGYVVDAAMIAAASSLDVIARAGAGMDNIDEQAAANAGIICLNAPEGNRNAVSEQTVGMMLALLHNIVKGNNEVKNQLWQREENRGFELGNKTVGIIGFGNTGSEVAKKLLNFGCRILVYDKFKSGFATKYIEECSLETLMQHADIITLHVPLTDLTYRWINHSFINSIAKPFYLLNLSRGKIMVTRDVIDGLNHGKILGLATDVLENENIKHGLEALSSEQKADFKELTERDNVIITPHIGGWSHESYRKISEVLADKILDVCNKRKKNGNIFAKG